MGETVVNIVQCKVKVVKEPILQLKCFLFRSWIQQSAKQQKSHNAIRVVFEILMSAFVIEKSIELKFVINFTENDMPIIFPVSSTFLNFLIRMYLKGKIFIIRSFLVHLFSDLGEVLNGV